MGVLDIRAQCSTTGHRVRQQDSSFSGFLAALVPLELYRGCTKPRVVSVQAALGLTPWLGRLRAHLLEAAPSFPFHRCWLRNVEAALCLVYTGY